MNYRFDKRSPEEFAKAIKDCTLIERKLMEVYVNWLNSTKGEAYTFSDHGVDNSGEFIKDDNKVNTKADFLLHTKGKRDKKIEIKFCRPQLTRFHLKVKQVEKYIKEDVCIVNFMGIESEEPRFCILTPKVLEEALKNNKRVNMWGKLTIRFNCVDCKWNNI